MQECFQLGAPVRFCSFGKRRGGVGGGGGGGGGAEEHPYCSPKKLTFFNLYATACFVQSQSVHSFLGGVPILVRLFDRQCE